MRVVSKPSEEVVVMSCGGSKFSHHIVTPSHSSKSGSGSKSERR